MKLIPIHKWPFSAISVSTRLRRMNLRNTTRMSVVKIIAFLEIEQKILIFGLEISLDNRKEKYA
jgi:hypothetical protein